jgi:hypothetical protein
VPTSAVNREPLLPTPLLRGASKRALPPGLAARAAAILLEHSRDNPLLLSRWLSTYNAQLPEAAQHGAGARGGGARRRGGAFLLRIPLWRLLLSPCGSGKPAGREGRSGQGLRFASSA